MPFFLRPTILGSAAASVPGTRGPVQHPTPVAPSALVADPAELVARALAILAEETDAWHARRRANPSPRSER